MSSNAVLNPRRHKLLRKRIARGENVLSVVLVAALAAIVAWILGQRDAFDPDERDLPPELLAQSGRQIEIYNRPLQPWVEPGTAPAATGNDLGRFPPSLVDARWRPTGRVREFDAANLYEKINGEAEKFLKLGFRSMSYVVLRSAEQGDELAVELYDQGDVAGSIGVFSDHAGDRPVEEREGVSFFMTSAGVIGRIGPFFFRAVGNRESEAIARKSDELVTAFATLGRAAPSAPPGLRLLTQGMGVAPADVAYERRNVFQFDFANDFWFGRVSDDPEARLFVHVAESDTDAAELLDALIAEQQLDYESVETDVPWAMLRHSVLTTYFVVARQGRFLFGVDHLSDAADAAAIMERFADTVSNE